MRKGTQKERIEMVSYCIDHRRIHALVYSYVKKFQKLGVAGLEDRRGRKQLISEMSAIEHMDYIKIYENGNMQYQNNIQISRQLWQDR